MMEEEKETKEWARRQQPAAENHLDSRSIGRPATASAAQLRGPHSEVGGETAAGVRRCWGRSRRPITAWTVPPSSSHCSAPVHQRRSVDYDKPGRSVLVSYMTMDEVSAMESPASQPNAVLARLGPSLSHCPGLLDSWPSSHGLFALHDMAWHGVAGS